MGNCCTPQENQIDQRAHQKLRETPRGESVRKSTNAKYYMEMKEDHQKMIKRKEEQIAERKQGIADLETQIANLNRKSDAKTQFQIQKLRRQIQTHQRLIKQLNEQIDRIKAR